MKNGRASVEFILFSLFLLFLFLLSFSNLPPFHLMAIIFGLIIFVIALVNTDLALIILIFSMLLSPEINVGGVPGRSVVIRIDDLFLIMVFLGWMAKMSLNKELGLLKSSALNIPITIYIVITMVATYFGYLGGFVKLKHSFFYILKYFEYFLLFFMVANNLRDIKQIKRFVTYMLFVCFIVSVYGIAQRMMGVMRITAPFEGMSGEANTLAGYLLLMMAVSIGIFLRSEKFGERLSILVLNLFASLAFLFTLSRGAWIAFVPMFITLIVLSKKNKPMLIGILLLLV
ncbi:hypothetical protein ACFL52_05370, partial [Candidatus Margulisiibacteriota bacterium]